MATDGYRKPTPKEAETLYIHLEQAHNIDRLAADVLQTYGLPYEAMECPHDYGLVTCMFCMTVVIIGIPFARIDKEIGCPCISTIPDNIAELTDGKSD